MRKNTSRKICYFYNKKGPYSDGSSCKFGVKCQNLHVKFEDQSTVNEEQSTVNVLQSNKEHDKILVMFQKKESENIIIQNKLIAQEFKRLSFEELDNFYSSAKKIIENLDKNEEIPWVNLDASEVGDVLDAELYLKLYSEFPFDLGHGVDLKKQNKFFVSGTK